MPWDKSPSICWSTRHVSEESRSFKCRATRRICLRFHPRPVGPLSSRIISASKCCTRHNCSPSEAWEISGGRYPNPVSRRTTVSREAVRPKSSSPESAGSSARRSRTRSSRRSAYRPSQKRLSAALLGRFVQLVWAVIDPNSGRETTFGSPRPPGTQVSLLPPPR